MDIRIEVKIVELVEWHDRDMHRMRRQSVGSKRTVVDSRVSRCGVTSHASARLKRSAHIRPRFPSLYRAVLRHIPPTVMSARRLRNHVQGGRWPKSVRNPVFLILDVEARTFESIVMEPSPEAKKASSGGDKQPQPSKLAQRMERAFREAAAEDVELHQENGHPVVGSIDGEWKGLSKP